MDLDSASKSRVSKTKNCKKIADGYNIISLSLLKGRSSYRRSLEPSKFFSLLILLWVIFDLLDPDPDPAVHPDPQHCWFKMTV